MSDQVDEGGDPACWLDQVCEECGRIRGSRPPAPCEQCGACPLPDEAESHSVQSAAAVRSSE
jgi:hypothetical protein